MFNNRSFFEKHFLCVVNETQMNTQILFSIKVNKQIDQLGKYFVDFNLTYNEIPQKLDSADIFHFKE